MKKFSISVLLFITVGIILYLVLIFITSSIKDKDGFSVLDKLTGNSVKTGISTFWQFHEAKYHTDPIDILVMGSSYGFRAFYVPVFNKNHLNIHILATSAQPPEITYYLLKEYLEIENPKLIIFDICYTCINSDGVESFYDLCKNIPVSLSLLFMAIDINRPYVYHNLVSAWISQINKSIYQCIKYPRPKYYNRGFISSSKKDTTLKFDCMKRSYKINKLTDQQAENLRFIESIAQYVKEKKTMIILTHQPSLWKYNVTYQVKIIAISRKYNVPFIDLDYYKYRLNPATDFYDKSHLNSSGAEKISEILIDEILKPNPEYSFLWSKSK